MPSLPWTLILLSTHWWYSCYSYWQQWVTLQKTVQPLFSYSLFFFIETVIAVIQLAVVINHFSNNLGWHNKQPVWHNDENVHQFRLLFFKRRRRSTNRDYFYMPIALGKHLFGVVLKSLAGYPNWRHWYFFLNFFLTTIASRPTLPSFRVTAWHYEPEK